MFTARRVCVLRVKAPKAACRVEGNLEQRKQAYTVAGASEILNVDRDQGVLGLGIFFARHGVIDCWYQRSCDEALG